MIQFPNISNGTNHRNFSTREIRFTFHKNIIDYALLSEHFVSLFVFEEMRLSFTFKYILETPNLVFEMQSLISFLQSGSVSLSFLEIPCHSIQAF